MKVLLETERLILREFTEDDVDLLVTLDSDPEVMFYINGGRATPREVLAEEHIPAYLRYHRDYPAYGFWVALDRATGDFLGWFHFRPGVDAPKDEPELGYRLLKSAWGKGYATEGSRALIDKGFSELDISRVNAETMVVNVGSRRVMEKSGLRQIRIFHQEWPDRIPGDELGDVEYAITRAEWQTARNLTD